MRRLLAVLVGVLLLPASSFAQTSGFSVRAIKAIDSALTPAGYFGFPPYPTVSLPTCNARNRSAVAFDTTIVELVRCNGIAWSTVGGATLAGNNTWTGQQNFLDNKFSILNSADNSKVLQFSLTGITTGNTIVPFAFGGTAAAPTITFPSGTVSNPSLLFTGSGATYGFWAPASGTIGIGQTGSDRMRFANQFFVFSSVGFLQWTSTSTAGGTVDLQVGRGGPATMQYGVDVNGAPVAQTIKGHNGITGTDVAGANLTIEGGLGTGAGAGGDAIVNRSPSLGTGTTAQSYFPAIRVVSKAKGLSTTSATTTTFVRVAGLGAHDAAGGAINFTVRVTDGTNDQMLSGIIRWSFVNTTAGAGGETCGAAVVGTVDATAANGGAASAGTASAVAATTTGTDLCDIQITPTFSLTATVVEMYYTVFSQSRTATLTPQ